MFLENIVVFDLWGSDEVCKSIVRTKMKIFEKVGAGFAICVLLQFKKLWKAFGTWAIEMQVLENVGGVGDVCGGGVCDLRSVDHSTSECGRPRTRPTWWRLLLTDCAAENEQS